MNLERAFTMKNLFNLAVFTAYALASGCGLILLKIAMSKHDLSLSTLRYVILDVKFPVVFPSMFVDFSSGCTFYLNSI